MIVKLTPRPFVGPLPPLRIVAEQRRFANRWLVVDATGRVKAGSSSVAELAQAFRPRL